MTFLTGITHGRPDRDRDRHRPVVATVDERVSLEAVVNAITDIMEDHNRLGIADRTLAIRIGRDVQRAVADAIGHGRISSSAQLTSQQAFWGILAQHLASTSSAHTDQQARQALLHYIRTQANRTGADFATFVAQFRRGGGYADRSVDRDGSSLLTSARFDGLSSADAALLARMRDVAIRHGLHWAADRPEILRMGEEAIRLLARTGFTRESHDRLHAAGFNHHQMVSMARYAERTGQEVNEVARVEADSVHLFGGTSEAERRRWIEMIDAYHVAPPGDNTARDRLVEALRRRRREGTPEQKDQADKHLELIERATGARLTADTVNLTASTETDAARADREAREVRERAEAAERAAREAERAAAAERARQEAAERAAAEEARRRLAALRGSGTPDPAPADAPVQEGPAPGAGQQRAEARPPNRPTVALT